MFAQVTLSDQAKISLLTCSPGEQIYVKFGHTALRVADPLQDIDLVFNYGVFSFSEDNFVMHFLAGETDYKLAVQRYQRFINSYDDEHRQVFEQPLLLDSAQRQVLFDKLCINAMPENSVYRYNFIYDNCATRPYAMLDSVVAGLGLKMAEQPDFGMKQGTTFRQAISYYTHTNSWGQLGIDICFGTDADRAMEPAEKLFLPELLMVYISSTGITPLTDVMPFEIVSYPFYTTPLFCLILLFLFLMAYIAWCVTRKRKIAYLPDALIYFLGGLIGVLLIFMWFFSEHAFVQNNWNLVALNPLMLILFITALFGKGRALLNGWQLHLFIYDCVVLLAYIISPQNNMLVYFILAMLIMLHGARLVLQRMTK